MSAEACRGTLHDKGRRTYVPVRLLVLYISDFPNGLNCALDDLELPAPADDTVKIAARKTVIPCWRHLSNPPQPLRGLQERLRVQGGCEKTAAGIPSGGRQSDCPGSPHEVVVRALNP